MKWFKHDSDAHMDARLKRLQMRYGMEGYGLYWHCLEVIAAGVDQYNLTFELEHDAEIISHDTGLHFEHVQEVMEYMVKLGLFENCEGTVTCLKLAKRLDQSMTSNSGLRHLISNLRDKVEVKSLKSHDPIMTKSSQNRTEQNRRDKTIGQNKNRFDLFWSSYPKKVKRKKAEEIWKRKRLDPLAEKINTDVQNRLQNDGRWLDGFIPDPTTYLNGERWEDELQKSTARIPELKSQSQIMRVGSQLGINARPGESMEDYSARVRNTRHD